MMPLLLGPYIVDHQKDQGMIKGLEFSTLPLTSGEVGGTGDCDHQLRLVMTNGEWFTQSMKPPLKTPNKNKKNS